jgi:plasmid stabilization system protein ParE
VTERALLWSARARANLREIGLYIARDKPIAAQRWIGVLTAAAEQVAAMPLVGRCVPEFGRDDVREVMCRGYRIVYLVSESQVEILAVFEGHRLLPDDILKG